MFTLNNILHSHVKRSPLLWFHVKISPFEMINYFIDVYSINRILHARLEKQTFSQVVLKNISRVKRTSFSAIHEKMLNTYLKGNSIAISSIKARLQ